MKTFIRIFTVLIVFGLVFTAPLLNAAEKKEAKKELCCAGCGEVIKGEAKFKTEYKGKTYYFAHEKCLKTFKADPEKALTACEGTCCSKGKKDIKDKKDAKKMKVAYVCPMKVCKVKQDKPGKCPKCGMALKKVELKEGHDHDHKDGHGHKDGDKDHKH